MVGRRDREVSALVADLVAAVAALLDPAGVPGAGDRVDVVVALVRLGLEPDVVEDVELGLGRVVRGVADPGRLQVVLRLAGDVARVAAVRLTGQRVVHEEVDRERLGATEGVDESSRRVGQQGHVGLVDLLEAANRRAVEHQPVLEDLRTERRHRHGEVLHDARQIAEPYVDELDALVLDVAEQLLSAGKHSYSYGWPWGSEIASTVGGADYSVMTLMFRTRYARRRPPDISAVRRPAAARSVTFRHARRASDRRLPLSRQPARPARGGVRLGGRLGPPARRTRGGLADRRPDRVGCGAAPALVGRERPRPQSAGGLLR